MTSPLRAKVRTLALAASLPFCGTAPAARASGELTPVGGLDRIFASSTQVETVVDDGIARTKVRQTFRSPYSRPIEARYTFPLPEGAAITGLAVETGPQRLEGFLADRRLAQRAYQSLVRRRIDPALLEQEKRSRFRLSVFPVLPNAETVLEVEYLESLPRNQGHVRWTFPQPSSSDSLLHGDFVFTLRFSSSAPIAACTSSEADLSIGKVSDHEVTASLERSPGQAATDLWVDVRTEVPVPTLRVRSFRRSGGEAYLAAVLTPPPLTEEERTPLDLTLLLDVSGSMVGTRLESACAAVHRLLRRLRPVDRVNLLLFEGRIERFAAELQPVTAETLDALHHFVDRAKAGGGTALGDAVTEACAMPAEPGRSAAVVVLTDGKPTVGETAREAICKPAVAAGERGIQVHTFGIGEDADGTLLDLLAFATGGRYESVTSELGLESRLDDFLAHLSSPALTEVRMEIDGVPAGGLAKDARRVGLGEQAVLTARTHQEGECDVVVRASVKGEELVLGQRVDLGSPTLLPSSHDPGAFDLYAQAELARLARADRLQSELPEAAYFAMLEDGSRVSGGELREAMIELSIESGIQCPFTAYFTLLPEDRARLSARDAAALEEAMERARQSQRDLVQGTDPRTGVTGEVFDSTLENEPVGRDRESANSPLDTPFDARDANDVIGTGGGAGGGFGGKYGHRGGKKAGSASQKAVDLGRDWFEARQLSNGSFLGDQGARVTDDVPSFVPQDDVSATALALLSLLGAGHTPSTGSSKEVVKSAVDFLLAVEDEGGAFQVDRKPVPALAQALASLALTETYALSSQPILREPAVRAARTVQTLLSESTSAALGEEDALVLAAELFALLAAEDASLVRSTAVRASAMERLQQIANAAAPSLEPDREIGVGDAVSAAWLLLRILERDTTALFADDPAVVRLASRLPRPGDLDRATSAWYLYYGSYAAWQIGGGLWTSWQRGMLEAVGKAQAPDGGWGPWQDGGGTVESTALATTILEVYYRYDRVFGSR